jgi:hypothetical protein
MRVPMCLAALLIAVLGCDTQRLTDALGAPADTIPAPSSRSHYVAPTGRSTGDGSRAQPWDLPTALSHPASVKPGDTIWLRGGTYRGDFSSKLTGREGAPVVLRQYPGERAIIDGGFEITGAFAYYWGFEVMYSDLKRVTTLPGTDPADLPRENKILFVLGARNKLINLVIHDLGHGIFAGSAAEGLEIYGNLIYNNGWRGGDRGHGHNLYLQNLSPTKYVVDNVLFSSFSAGLHIYGTDAAYLWNFVIEGNTVFDSGSPLESSFGVTLNLQQEGGGGNFGRSIYRGNSIYHRNGLHEAFRFNAPGHPAGEDIQFVDNIVQGRSQFYEVRRYVIKGNKITSGANPISGQNVLVSLRMAPGEPLSAHTWDENRYASPPGGSQYPFYYAGAEQTYLFPGWKAATGYDNNSSFTSGMFTGADIIVRPNRFESGRAFITCWNWASATSLNVDLAAVLTPGDRYQIHHVYDVFGPPVVTGTYGGGGVSIPQAAATPPVPIGLGTAPTSPGRAFNVFLVRRL